MHKPLIAALVLLSAYAVANTLEPPNEPAQLVTPSPSAVGEAAGGVFKPLSEHPGGVAPQAEADLRSAGAIPAEPANERPPHAVSAVTTAASSPAAGGFCTTGNCGPAQSRRVYQVQRPVRRGLFGGLFRGRR